MQGIVYKNSAKDITLEQAVNAYKVGIRLEINDGKDITMSIEKEPIAGKQNRS